MYEFKFDEEDYDMYKIIYADNPIKILVEDKFGKYWTPCGRNPYYQMRGKRISEEQAFDIICRTDCTLVYDLELEGSIPYYNFRNDWFGYYGGWSRSGWVHPNGIVGINGIMPKYPTVDEFAHEWTTYLYNFPFLDLIVGITWWNEKSNERYEIQNINNWHEFDYLGYDDFCDNLEAGIWVHDGKIEIINREHTIEVYKQYEKLYEIEDKRVYFNCYYEDFQLDITTMKYLERCLAKYGIMDCEKFLREKLGSRRFEELKKTIL